MPVSLQVIPGAAGLDEVRVYWEDFGQAKGQFTVTCYGQSWTSYFGAMWPGCTIRQFVSLVEVDYLVNRMLDYTLPAKKFKQHEAYLTKIITAVQGDLKAKEATTC